MEQNIDIKENYIYQLDSNLLAILLLDKSSGKNIIWATDNYSDRGLGYQSEAMMPVYENLYVKQFVLYDDESVSYYFAESREKEDITTEKSVLKNENQIAGSGKYGKLNDMTKMAPASRRKAMIEYQEEEIMAEHLFKIY